MIWKPCKISYLEEYQGQRFFKYFLTKPIFSIRWAGFKNIISNAIIVCCENWKKEKDSEYTDFSNEVLLLMDEKFSEIEEEKEDIFWRWVILKEYNLLMEKQKCISLLVVLQEKLLLMGKEIT